APRPRPSVSRRGTPGWWRRRPRCGGTRRRARPVRGASSDGDSLLVRLERARDRDPALDVGAELDERQLDRRERGRDVEDVEPPDVTDAEDLALEATLAGGERDAVPVSEVAEQLGSVDAVRDARDRHDGRRVVVRREEL